ncbi:sorbosone dehydrogenase family protein [Deinococcus metallilatus]|uniref:Glucose/arabinose dehydrogenase n=1 Tax=Deinococcus metallilatus TaxID=1211322 RepID=A0AAJ5F858_9DEIO|nr:sorbosone dehydrogenase family protein [Deinococcus metallilatus]MBB5295114.1 glucose/arabinose dehydrogenase [Deinococcus metallilatus]QBY08707.1 sorbosone dehydrogenase family protein [Deinococcus metallilatus]RXJ10586.1 sorbosone dehydrogenase family protein [Deinococcus metallilatus]TLK26557.1 sorbosone dehydrogenase family protein [Deinococcus metallilatus]
MLKRMLVAGALALAASAGAQTPDLKAPDGFKVTVFSEGFKQPRFMAVAPNGDVFVSDPGAGTVTVLPDQNKNGVADGKTVFASGLNRPHGLAFHDGFLYVANTDGVVRFAYQPGQREASGAPQKLLSLPSGGGHWTRTVVFGPDGKMYVATGSSCNVCEESNSHRASVWVYDADGTNGKPYATGLRNPVGLEWYGGTLYATNNGRDMLGDNLPPEGFYKLRAGGFYGWPYCYTTEAGQPQVWDKDFGKKSAAVCQDAIPAFALTTAHAAPLGLAFYDGKTFPDKYRGQMFAALHGSWNRSTKSGYKVVTVNPETGQVADFLTGFLSGQRTLGRPVDLVVAQDGALLLTDDDTGRIWRIQYMGK